MNNFLSVISAVSDTVLLLIEIVVLSIVTGKQFPQSRVIVAVIFTVITSVLTELFFYQCPTIIKYIWVIINSFKCCLLALFVFRKFSVRNIMLLMIVQFSCSLINSGIYAVIQSRIKIYCEYFYPALLLSVRIGFLLISLMIKRKLKKTSVNNAVSIIPTHIYILILTGIFIGNGLIEGLIYQTSKYEIKIRSAQILSLLLVLCVSILILSLTVNVAYKRYYVTLNKFLEDQVELQLCHYEKLEKINMEIRRFRHDYTNHMNCLGAMLKSEKYTEATDYIENISGRLPSGEFLFKTGNYIADAILTDKQEKAAVQNISIKFDGCITDKISNTDLCIILSNALDNSIEACSKIDGEKEISVYGNFQQGYFVLIIKNPTKNTLTVNGEFPATSKDDKAYHGFGLSNIRFVVDKYNGTMRFSSENNFFILCLTFNNILTDNK